MSKGQEFVSLLDSYWSWQNACSKALDCDCPRERHERAVDTLNSIRVKMAALIDEGKSEQIPPSVDLLNLLDEAQAKQRNLENTIKIILARGPDEIRIPQRAIMACNPNVGLSMELDSASGDVVIKLVKKI